MAKGSSSPLVLFLQGDSGFMVYRRNTEGYWYLVLDSGIQTSGFNCPRQMSAAGGGATVYDANVDNFLLQEGDLVILGKHVVVMGPARPGLLLVVLSQRGLAMPCICNVCMQTLMWLTSVDGSICIWNWSLMI
jgi:hypothetical protein